MKKVILFTIISVSLYSVAKAQISKGSILLGGGISINDTKYDQSSSSSEIKENHISINPAVGIAIKDNLVAGIKLNYGRSENSYDPSMFQPSLNESTSYGGGVFLRKYLQLGKGFYLFGDGSLDFTKYKEEQSYTPINAPSFQSIINKGWNVSLGFNPGISYAINTKFHLEAGLPNLLILDYGKSKKDINFSGGVEKTTFRLGSNASSLSSFNFGFRFLFTK